ncbi:MAG: ISNCY family transposase [Deltaproteobacteria bacterium]|nr:ISNCY family transposase [Deltaproteobacteria bacterium]
MSLDEARRLSAAERVLGGEWTMCTAAEAVGLSLRQMRRLVRKVEADGAEGVLHGNRGRVPANKHSEAKRRRVVALARGKYTGFNDAHLAEKLLEVEGLEVGRATLQRWLRQAGVGASRKRRAPRHRQRRERMPQAGMMLLWDGSRHDWLEGRGPMLCLVGAIDDATGELMPGACFVDQECTAAYMHVLRAVLKQYGVPWRCYGDRHVIFRRSDERWTLEEELKGRQEPTQLGRVLEELGIERVDALTPQAKGRVERLWGTMQDRLTSELRLAKARTLHEASAVLEKYLPAHNRKFRLAPRNSTPAWRPLPQGLDIERMVSFRYEAIVLNDNTVRLEGQVIDIPKGPSGRSYAKAKVELRQLLDGSWRVYHRDACIAQTQPTSLRDVRAKKRKRRSASNEAFRRAVLAMSA